MSSTKKERAKHRDLIRWDNDKDIDCLLAIVKQCGTHGLKIPWDAVGRDIGDRVSGNAVQQHIAKLKKKVEETRRNGTKTVSQKSGFVGGGSKTQTGSNKKPVAKVPSKKTRSTEEDGDEFDVDRASDPDESYGETRAKRSAPRRAKAVPKKYKEAASDEDSSPAGMSIPQETIRVKAELSGSSPLADEYGSSPLKKRKMDSSSGEIDTPTKPRQRRSALKNELDDNDNDGEQYVAVGSRFLDFDRTDHAGMEGAKQENMRSDNKASETDHKEMLPKMPITPNQGFAKGAQGMHDNFGNFSGIGPSSAPNFTYGPVSGVQSFGNAATPASRNSSFSHASFDDLKRFTPTCYGDHGNTGINHPMANMSFGMGPRQQMAQGLDASTNSSTAYQHPMGANFGNNVNSFQMPGMNDFGGLGTANDQAINNWHGNVPAGSTGLDYQQAEDNDRDMGRDESDGLEMPDLDWLDSKGFEMN